MDSSPLQLFKEISQMNKEFRYSILHSMPKEYRFDVGAEILKLMREIKFTIYKSVRFSKVALDCNSRDILIEMLLHLKIEIDDCCEDGLLSVKGSYTIVPPRKRLMEILQQLGVTEDAQQ